LTGRQQEGARLVSNLPTMMRDSTRLLAVLLALATALTGVALADEPAIDEDDERTFYLRRTGCEVDMRLSTQPGEGEGGCGFTLTGLNEVNETLGNETLTRDYPSMPNDGVPVDIDVERNLSGQVTLGNFGTTQGVAAGRAWIDIRLTGQGRAGDGPLQTVTIADGRTEDYIPVPSPVQNRFVVEFDIPISAEAEGLTFTNLTVAVTVNGTHVGHGAVIHDGESFAVVPVIPDEDGEEE
jgi:hypothetical protein